MKFASFLFNRRTLLSVLAVLFAAILVGLLLTRGSDPAQAPAPMASGVVDETPLATARRLASKAYSAGERTEAAEALRVADHEVDEAFATALREASAPAAPPKGEARVVAQKISALEITIADQKQRLASLTSAAKNAVDQDDAAQQVALAQAQMDLDNDELADLHQDLIRLGADKTAKIQQALDEHEAAQKQSAAWPAPGGEAESPQSLETLPGKVRAFFEIDARDREVRAAGSDATTAASRLTEEHERMEQAAEQSAAQPPVWAGSTPVAIDTLHALSSQRKTMMEYDSRIHDEQQLATIYESWHQIVAARKRWVVHQVFLSLDIVAALLLLAIVVTLLIRRRFTRSVEERRRLGHLRVVVELLVQLFVLVMILIVIFGPPTQVPAIIGLATAGATIVMKDFILAFIGWFPLMGKNGIRVGDWVEINGVSGEVVEIGMMRTILLETGNWADAGHPTGRRVTFMNSFAIEGRYFNFSTSGQWLWDELRVTVPRGADANNRIAAIGEVIANATQQDAAVAEEEWRNATKDEALGKFSAAPSMDLRPAVDGIEVTVRYITRAQKRYEVRSRLYQEMIQVLHYEGESPPQPAVSTLSIP